MQLFFHEVRVFEAPPPYYEDIPHDPAGRQQLVSKSALEVFKAELPAIQTQGWEVISVFPFGSALVVVLKAPNLYAQFADGNSTSPYTVEANPDGSPGVAGQTFKITSVPVPK